MIIMIMMIVMMIMIIITTNPVYVHKIGNTHTKMQLSLPACQRKRKAASVALHVDIDNDSY